MQVKMGCVDGYVLEIRVEDLRRVAAVGANQVHAVVKGRQFLDNAFLCKLACGDAVLRLRMPLDEALDVGASVDLALRTARSFVFVAGGTDAAAADAPHQ